MKLYGINKNKIRLSRKNWQKYFGNSFAKLQLVCSDSVCCSINVGQISRQYFMLCKEKSLHCFKGAIYHLKKMNLLVFVKRKIGVKFKWFCKNYCYCLKWNQFRQFRQSVCMILFLCTITDIIVHNANWNFV